MIGQYGKHQKNEPLKKTLVIILFILVSVNLLLKHKVQYFQGLNGQGVGVVKE